MKCLSDRSEYVVCMYVVRIATRVTVSLSPRHSGKVEGLCGDFDGNYQNDFVDLLTGQIAATPNDYARLWKTAPSCPDPEVPQDFDPCAVSFQHCSTAVVCGMIDNCNL